MGKIMQLIANILSAIGQPRRAFASILAAAAMLVSLGCAAQDGRPGYGEGPGPEDGNIRVVRSIEGDSYMVGPNGDAEVKIKIRAEDTRNAFEVITEDHPKGFQSEPHLHPVGSETFYIISGTYDYTIGEETGRLHAGDILHVPPNTIHVMHALEVGRVLMIYNPPGIEQRTKAIASMTPEELAVPGAVPAKLAEYGHESIMEEDHGHEH